jgi:hypothetical protein
MFANLLNYFAPARCHERAIHHCIVSVGIVLTCIVAGCQPSTEPNKSAAPSDSSKPSVASNGGAADGTKDSSKSQDETTNPDTPKESENKNASDTPIADTAEEAKQLIIDCIKNYGALKSYQDEAVLHLSVPLEKDPILEIRPLKIAFERPNKLAMN